MISYSCQKKVPKYIRETVKSVIRWWRETQTTNHKIHIKIVGDNIICYNYENKVNYGFGLFDYHKNCIIYVAAGAAKDFDTYPGELVASTLIHELVHYEQYRDKRQVQERGVAVRTKNLLRQWERWHS